MRRYFWILVTIVALAWVGLGPTLEAQRRARQAAGAQPEAAPQEPAEATPPLDAPAPGALSPRNANYSIDVRLDPESRTLTGREILTWRNIAPIAATELRFHLYYNAWRNTQSTWMRERLLAGDTALAERPPDEWGWIDVTSVRLLGAGAPLDLSGQTSFIAPDDGNEQDRTVLAVPLPEAVEPGGTINIEIEWLSHVPRTFSRTGAIDDYFFIAQWFPKIGVLEEGGWNCHQFHANTEFYADFGVYDVRITVPAGWVVGATGVEREQRTNQNGTTTHRYTQADVHDFAWTTSPDFTEHRARFEHPTLPDVQLRLLLQPEHSGQEDRHFEATRATLKYYGEWYGPYPYEQLTIVDPAYQSGTGGMEYPTLFTAGSRWIAPADVTQPESVTIHEAGHQFWYGIVANNEFEHAWLDEGFNTFSTARTIAQVFEPNYLSTRFFGGFVPYVFRDLPRSRETDGNRLSGYREVAESDVQAAPTFQYWPGTHARITYDKTALWLNTLENYLGWPTLQRILSEYFGRWKFRHPQPADFFAVVNEVAERDLTWFFDEVHRSSNVFDYGVQQLTSRRETERGYYERGDTLAYQAGASGEDPFRTDVVVRRYGEAVFPVDLLITFEDGSTVREEWDGVDRWKQYTYFKPSRASSAQIDPDRVLLLDVDYTNNSRTLSPKSGAAATKWAVKWMVWMQDLLATWAFFV